MLTDRPALLLAGASVFFATVISLFQIIGHLRYYMEPTFQRYIVRILFAVPVYSIASFLSLKFESHHIYFETVRDLYEAWILYNFLSLCLAYLGGPGAVVVKSEGKQMEPSWLWLTCCLPSMPVDGHFIRRTKQGVLQFVLLKPIIAALILLLYNLDKYEEGDWSVGNGYLWIQVIYNFCYTLALYSLVVFYQGTEELLAPFRPLMKFVMVKSVIFFTFWQGLFVSIVLHNDPEDAKSLQNFLICHEMLGAAILMNFAFPYREYKLDGAKTGLGRGSIGHAVSIQDVVSDTYHQFAPAYHEYVLYSDSNTGSKQIKKHIRTRTFVKVGNETQKYMDDANLLANVEMQQRPTGNQTIPEESVGEFGNASGGVVYDAKGEKSCDEVDGSIELSELIFDPQTKRIDEDGKENTKVKDYPSKGWWQIDLGDDN